MGFHRELLDYQNPHRSTIQLVACDLREMLRDYSGLAVFTEAAKLLAQKNWPELYNFKILVNNSVPLEVLFTMDDFYVNVTAATAALKKTECSCMAA